MTAGLTLELSLIVSVPTQYIVTSFVYAKSNQEVLPLEND